MRARTRRSCRRQRTCRPSRATCSSSRRARSRQAGSTGPSNCSSSSARTRRARTRRAQRGTSVEEARRTCFYARCSSANAVSSAHAAVGCVREAALRLVGAGVEIGASVPLLAVPVLLLLLLVAVLCANVDDGVSERALVGLSAHALASCAPPSAHTTHGTVAERAYVTSSCVRGRAVP